MQIKEILVDGFGIHRDLHITNITEGLNVVYGDNENGKTTLRNFITSILFGFKPRNDLRRHSPVNGGSHGGKLYVKKDGASTQISRLLLDNRSNTEANIHSSDKKDLKLEDLLGGINRGVYENIFSFGLDELNGLKSLSDKEVMEHIYTAGFGIRSNDIKGIKRDLTETLDYIWKNKGEKVLNVNLDKLNKVINQKIECQRKSDSYILLRQQLEQINDDIDNKALINKRLQEKLVLLKGLEQGFPIYTELVQLEKQLGQNQVDGEFSQQIMAELESHVKRLEELKEESVVKKSELNNFIRQVETTPINLQLLGGDQKLKDLERLSLSIRENIKQQRQKIKDAQEHQQKIQSLKMLLNENITKDVEDIKISLGLDEQLNEINRAYSDKNKELDIIIREIDVLNSEINEIELELASIRIKDTEQLENTINILYDIKTQWDNSGKNSSVPTVLSLLNLLAISFLGWLGYSPWLLAIFGIATMPLSIYQIYRNLIEPRKKQKALYLKLQRISEGTLKSISGIVNCIKDYERELLTLQNINKGLEKKKQRILYKESEAEGVRSFLKELNYEKECILAQVGINKELNPTIAIMYLSKIQEVQNIIKEYNKTSKTIEEMEDEQRKFQTNCVDLLMPLGYINSSDEIEEWLLCLQMGINDLEKEKQLNITIQKVQDKIIDVEKAIGDIHGKIQVTEERIQQVLNKGKVNTYDDYIREYNKYLLSVELGQAKLTAESKLVSVLPGELSEILSKFKGVSIPYLEAEILSLTSEIENNKKGYEGMIQDRGRIQKEIEDIESNNSLEEILFEEEMLKEKIRQDTTKWCTYKTAMVLLEKTIKIYEDKTQPNVFKRAEKYFSKITGFKYQNIKVKRERQQIVVCDKDGREINVELLSRGTQEQLYISVRLGLIEEFSMKSGGLPLLFDDIFVNFDEQRTKEALDLLTAFCEEHQVFFFTCHRRILDILEGNDKVNVINL